MANWAVVIGIDEYWREEVCLRGAVQDALRMREWLLDPDGGAVPARNLFLVLGPRASRPVPDGIDHEPAHKDHIVRVINRLLQKSGGEGERLYFYFAGHGLSMEVALNKYEHALIASDFDYVVADNSIGVGSLLPYFKSTSFEDQFFFLDACRNVLDQRFEIGRLPSPPRRDFSRPEPQQFVMYATSPGVKAKEMAHAGGEGGAFTDALLAGLRGAGRAKRYDANRDRHTVRWDALFEYVRSVVEARKIGFGDGSELIQLPREAGERGVIGRSADPELAVLDPGTFADEPLRIELDPDAALPAAKISIVDPADPFNVRSLDGLTTQPEAISLPPRPYAVAARAAGFRAIQRSWLVELYAPSDVRLSFEAAPDEPDPAAEPGRPPGSPGGPPRGPSRGPSRPSRGSGSGRGTGGPVTSRFEVKPLYGTLRATAPDPLAIVELADLSGRVIASGRGRLERDDVPPGMYVAQMRTTTGAGSREPVLMQAGETVEIDLAPPAIQTTPLLTSTMDTAGIFVDGHGTLRVSEALDGIAGGDMGTVLTLAGIRATFGDDLGWGHRLNGVGLRNIGRWFERDAPSALYVACADELGGSVGTDRLASLRLAVWQPGEDPPESELALSAVSAPGIGEFGTALEPGAFWLLLHSHGRLVILPMHALPGHITFVVMHGRSDGDIVILQHMPPLALLSDPVATLEQARHLDLAERALLYDRYDDAGDPDHLLRMTDPIARLLGVHLALRAGRIDHAEAVANDLAGVFSDWSDAHVMVGDCATARSDEPRARARYIRALDSGLPGLAADLARLNDAATRHGIDHRLAGDLVLAARTSVPGVLWSAFVPEHVASADVDISISTTDARRGVESGRTDSRDIVEELMDDFRTRGDAGGAGPGRGRGTS